MTLRNRLLAMAMLAMAGTVATHADHFIVVHTDTDESKYQLGDVEEITFGEEGITVKTANVSSAFSYSDISKIDFSNTTAGLQKMEQQQEGLVAYDHTIEYKANPTAQLYVCDIAGKTVATGQGKIDTSSLPHGIYVVRAGHQSFKFVR